MLESMFYNIWKETISQRWRTLTERMAKIAWNQHHRELGTATEEACKNACEKLVCDSEMKYAPKIDDIIKRIVHEGRPKANNPFEHEDENEQTADPRFADMMWAAARVMAGGNDQRKLETIDMIPSICKQYNVPFPESTRETYHILKLRIQTRMKAEAPQRKAEAAHGKKLTKAEWIAQLKRRRAESKTLGNALKGVLK